MKGKRNVARAWLFAVGLVVLAGCASGPKIYSNANPNANLAEYSSFGFSPRLGTDRGNGQRSIVSTHLMNAARAELEKLGYRYDETDPDLQVNFYLNTKEKIRASSTPSAGMGMNYYGYRRGYYGTWGGYDTTVTQYTEGTLNVDVIDTARRELVWEGVAVGRLRDDVRENMGERARVVMADLFARYPLAPSG